MSNQIKTRKEQILNSALEIISEEGVKKLTMKKIASRIGISDAALYRHFQNKQTLMKAMIETVGDKLVTKINLAVRDIDNPVEKLNAVLHVHLTYLEKNRGIPRVIFSDEVHQNNPILRNSVLKIVNNYMDLIRGFLLQAKKAKRVKKNIDIEASATAFLGLLQATALLWSLSGFGFPVRAKAPALWRVISDMLH